MKSKIQCPDNILIKPHFLVLVERILHLRWLHVHCSAGSKGLQSSSHNYLSGSNQYIMLLKITRLGTAHECVYLHSIFVKTIHDRSSKNKKRYLFTYLANHNPHVSVHRKMKSCTRYFHPIVWQNKFTGRERWLFLYWKVTLFIFCATGMKCKNCRWTISSFLREFASYFSRNGSCEFEGIEILHNQDFITTYCTLLQNFIQDKYNSSFKLIETSGFDIILAHYVWMSQSSGKLFFDHYDNLLKINDWQRMVPWLILQNTLVLVEVL